MTPITIVIIFNIKRKNIFQVIIRIAKSNITYRI